MATEPEVYTVYLAAIDALKREAADLIRQKQAREEELRAYQDKIDAAKAKVVEADAQADKDIKDAQEQAAVAASGARQAVDNLLTQHRVAEGQGRAAEAQRRAQLEAVEASLTQKRAELDRMKGAVQQLTDAESRARTLLQSVVEMAQQALQG